MLEQFFLTFEKKRKMLGRIGNGVQISDRTAAVKWSRRPHAIDRKIEKTTGGDEAKSEDLPVERTYQLLRTKEGYVP